VGGCTLEAAEAVCNADGDLEIDLLDGLDALVSQSLLRQDEVAGEPRFSMLETIREFGREQLAASEEETAMARRHAAYFLRLAEETEPKLRGPEQVEWLDRLEREHDNFRAALAWSQSAVDDAAATLGLSLAGALCWFWAHRHHWTEGRRWLEQALERTTHLGRTRARANALAAAAHMASAHGDVRGGRPLADESVAIWQELGDRVGLALSLYGICVAKTQTGDGDTAHSLAADGVAACREKGEEWGLAMALWMLGACEFFGRRRLDLARQRFDESIALFRKLGDQWGIGAPLSYRGWVARDEGDRGAARADLEAALAAHRVVSTKWRISWNLGTLAALELDDGNLVRAAALYAESLALNQDLGRNEDVATTHLKLGQIARRAGDPGRAREHYREGLTLFRDVLERGPIYNEQEDRRRITTALQALGELEASAGQGMRAARLSGAAAALRQTLAASGTAPSDDVPGPAPEATAAWEQGRAMSLDQAIAYALEDDGDA
jgi:non-specific serine/threonine protein kinase